MTPRPPLTAEALAAATGEALRRIIAQLERALAEAREAAGMSEGRTEAEVRADERARIRALAERTGAVCPGDDGTSCYFADLIQ